jgi:hypothetical protein
MGLSGGRTCLLPAEAWSTRGASGGVIATTQVRIGNVPYPCDYGLLPEPGRAITVEDGLCRWGVGTMRERSTASKLSAQSDPSVATNLSMPATAGTRPLRSSPVRLGPAQLIWWPRAREG